MASKSQAQFHFPALPNVPAQPQARTLRRFQSHQNLSTKPPPVSTPARQLPRRDPISVRDKADPDSSSQIHTPAPSTPSHGRHRSNSDVTSPTAIRSLASKPRPSSRKSGSMGFPGRRSGLELLLRDGPPSSDLAAGLGDLRYLILSNRVDADGDGMSPLRIYVWLTLLNIPPLPTDEYLSLVHRGRSPAYAKIRNDTFRTLATDPLFKRRVTEASLIRLLNAVAWKINDSKKGASKSRSSTPSHNARHSSKLSTNTLPSPISEDGPSPQPPQQASTSDPAIYVQGMNVLCAPFLYASRSEVEAFALFHHFITRECPGYVRGAMDGVHKGVKLVDKCLEIVEPKLATHLFSKGMYAELYAFPSVLTLCACTPPLPEVLHLWDFLFAYGPHLNILCIVAQLIRMRDTLLATPSPNKLLRSFPALDAKEVIGLAVLIVKKIPGDLYEELVQHAR
ncbi:CDC16 protein [Ophidiomyces ophidiicola]|nr:CDC16 protein [Ophidiomyces ophidiicola]KAI1936498.1 CDC16 protein [Ophidiomyces ophidiicola]KAI1955891.1 CDC16 protein [Ophidiomyces ophidiicola]